MSLKPIIGTFLMMLISGLSSLAGLGGGGPNIVVMMVFFDVLPKKVTLTVFASIVGASLGNVTNQMRRALDGQPIIKYDYAFVTLPIMFIGSLIGVLTNKFLPSLVNISIIMLVSISSVRKIYQRFRHGYCR